MQLFQKAKALDGIKGDLIIQIVGAFTKLRQMLASNADRLRN